ncbi:hypothetical protein PFISCL1PPCAC_24038, partial [Pristionchus fissidentatus]
PSHFLLSFQFHTPSLMHLLLSFALFLPLSFSRELDRLCHSLPSLRFSREISSFPIDKSTGLESTERVCYVVEDNPGLHKWNRHTRSLILTSPYLTQNVSVVYLKKPKSNGIRAIIGKDTRLWRVDHAHDPFLQAIRAQFLMPIALKAMPLYSKYEEHNVLIFGLAGGASSMYLRFQRPKINITIVEEEKDVIDLSKRWFGLLEDSRYSIVHAKADSFLQDAFENDRRYDVISVDWLDSTDLSISARMIISEIPKLASESLTSSGVFIVHIISPMDHEYQMILSSLLSHFSSCLSLRLANHHIIITCYNKKFIADTTKPFVERFHTVSNYFRFKTSRHFISLTLHSNGKEGETVMI